MFSCVGVFNDFLVNLLEIVLPCSADIGWGTVGGSFKDQKADVEILSGVGIRVEQLDPLDMADE